MNHITTPEQAQQARERIATLRDELRTHKRLLGEWEAGAALRAEGKSAEQRAAAAVISLSIDAYYQEEVSSASHAQLEIELLEATLARYAEERKDLDRELKAREIALAERA
jgi:hypothetical protein